MGPLGEGGRCRRGRAKAGKIKHLYKVSGQRRVLGVIDAESHDELDAIIMAGLPMSHVLEWEEIVPVREYTAFGADVRKRWQLSGRFRPTRTLPKASNSSA